jgi:putative RecB family exonuclease
LYRFRAIDRIPEEPSAAALRGTVVHAALEDLHNLPAHERTPDTARALIGPAWQRAQAERPTGLGLSGEQVDGLLTEAGVMMDRYFRIEDPTRFTAAATEARFEVTLDDGTPLRGIIDRIDVAAGGETRVVDYKTSKSPSEAFESSALFHRPGRAITCRVCPGLSPNCSRTRLGITTWNLGETVVTSMAKRHTKCQSILIRLAQSERHTNR